MRLILYRIPATVCAFFICHKLASSASCVITHSSSLTQQNGVMKWP